MTGATDCGKVRAVTPTRYRIVVKGRLTDSFATAFEGLTVVAFPGGTALEGDFQDQSQLHGLLDVIRNLGIELVSLNAIP
jgi:hypothetical protein